MPAESREAASESRLQAYFSAPSAVPGRSASLLISRSTPGRVDLQLFRVGPNARRIDGASALRGVPVAGTRTVAIGRNWTRVVVPIWHWPSGVYFARVRDDVGQVAFAPVVVRAPGFDRPRVAVVVPTNTWQAYNPRDDDADGRPDSWYFDETETSVQLYRPYASRGVPPHYRDYDQPMLAWLARTGKRADYLSDDDLGRFPSGEWLSRSYDLIVFAGHEEYVTEHVYDIVQAFRDRGGNLAFYSANNFFYRVARSGATLTRAGRWRDLGRPEAALVGAQYVGWYENQYANAPYVVTGSSEAPWLFAGTDLRDDAAFGGFGIEVDARAPASPPQTKVLAVARNIFGAGASAEMTYYTTTAGAKVFAAGALNFGGSAWSPPIATMLENLWANLSRP